jgi:hypothetical protein
VLRGAGLVRRWSLVVVVLGPAAGLAACGSTAQQSTGISVPSTSTTTTTVSESTGTSSAAVSDQAHAARAAAPPGCSSHRISVSIGLAAAGLGHIGLPLLFRNTGSSTCVLTGYPGVALVRAAGAGQVQASRTLLGYLGGLAGTSTAAPVIRVRPGETISALLEGDDNPAHGTGVCPSFRALLVTPPNQTVTVRLARALSTFCSPQIHPVVAGASGRQS